MARIVRVLACLASLFTGCQPDEYAILIEAEAALNVATVVVTVVPLSGGRSYPSGPFRVNRTAMDIENEEPIRIAIELDGPNEVMVHLRAQSPDGVNMIASRCYRVTGVIHDNVLLFGTDMLDRDGDGWLADPSESCFAADGSPCTAHQCRGGEDLDCNDLDPSFNPGAPEICADGLDQDCRDGDVACADDDGDGFDNCSADSDPATCDCNDQLDSVYPGATEVCEDGLDQNCDGTDEFCDGDGDGYPGNVDCDDTDATVHPAADELCTPRDPMTGMELSTPRDEDCDGRIDELIECENGDMDGDGQIGCWHPDGMAAAPNCDCNDCDRGVNTGAFDQCGNGVDEDCSGADATCPPGDMDFDGFAGMAAGGPDCDDTDPAINPEAREICGDGIDQTCDGSDQSCDGDTDGDGYVEDMACEGNRAINYGATESCNGIDDDCDMVPDEVLEPPSMISGNPLPHGFAGCISMGRGGCEMTACTVTFADDRSNCGSCGYRCNRPDREFANACVDGRCMCTPEGRVCSGPEACCADGCRDVETDLRRCGACDIDCDEVSDGVIRPPNRPLASRCVGGMCQCGAGPKCVGTMENVSCCSDTGDPAAASCVDTNTTNLHCGECGHLCGPRMRCTGGGCVCTEAGWDDCNPPNDADGCETDIMNSVEHCGGCGRACNLLNVATHTCSGGVCMIATCDPGWDDCNGIDSDGCETPLNTLTNCGVCGNTCDLGNATESCADGTCRVVACSSGWGDCDSNPANGCETQLNSLTNCGACGTGCNLANASESCSSGACRLQTCSSGFDNCDGSEGNGCEAPLNTLTDCGSCRTSCSRANATATCSTGSCMIASCNARFDNCNGTDSDGCETSLQTISNCQACGSSCPTAPNGTPSCNFTSGCSFACNSGYCPMGSMMCVRNDTIAACGSSCTMCSAPTNAAAACVSGSCSWTCNSGYCPVSGSCVSNSDNVNACGSGCTSCPNRANATRTCTSGTCGFTCNAGWADCDGMAGNGCEADLSNPATCGACGDACGMGESCNFDTGMSRYRCCCGSNCRNGEVCNGGQNCCGMPLMCTGSC